MVMEEQNTKYGTLQKKLDVLRKNREVLTEEELETRYATAYRRLKTEISDLLREMQTTELSHIRLSKELPVSQVQEIKECFTPYWERIVDTAFTQYDVNEIMTIWTEFRVVMVSNFGATIDLVYHIDTDK